MAEPLLLCPGAGDGEAPVIEGFTGDRRFFLSWAQLGRDVTQPDVARQLLLSDPHSPNDFRVATVRNFEPCHKAFDAQEGDKMYLPPANRVNIW